VTIGADDSVDARRRRVPLSSRSRRAGGLGQPEGQLVPRQGVAGEGTYFDCLLGGPRLAECSPAIDDEHHAILPSRVDADQRAQVDEAARESPPAGPRVEPPMKEGDRCRGRAARQKRASSRAGLRLTAGATMQASERAREGRPRRARLARDALLAQLVEHFHGKEGVSGSSPEEGFRTNALQRARLLAPLSRATVRPRPARRVRDGYRSLRERSG